MPNQKKTKICSKYFVRFYIKVKTIIDLGTSPYKANGEDRDIFKRVFKFDLLAK